MVASRTLDERVAAFTAAANQAASAVVEVAGLAEAAEQAVGASPDGAVVVTRAVADGPVGAALQAAGGRVRAAAPDDPPETFADAAVGLVTGEMAVAETGSVLVVEHELCDRLVTMLSRHLIQVVDRETVADSLAAAAAWLSARPAGAAFATLMTGPSRSADIERSLTIGVQGPDRVTVVVTGRGPT